MILCADAPGVVTLRRHHHGRAWATISRDPHGWRVYAPGRPERVLDLYDDALTLAREWAAGAAVDAQEER